MLKAWRVIFIFNAALFVLVISLTTALYILDCYHWKPGSPFSVYLVVWALAISIMFRFIQLNLKLFPAGLELDFWNHFGLTFPRTKNFFFVGLMIYQLSLCWWMPALVKLPGLIGNIGAYIAMQAGNVELAEQLYAFQRKSDGTSFAVFSTYALVNRGTRRADDPRIDDAIRKVYGDKSPEMHERKRLLADFILMTQGNVPEVEKLRSEAGEIDPKKYTWKNPFRFLLGKDSCLEFAQFYDLPKYKAAILNYNPNAKCEPPQSGGPGLIGAPVEPRYGSVMMDIPSIYCFASSRECDGTPGQTLWRYRVKFFHHSTTEIEAETRHTSDLLLWFIPASLLLELFLLLSRKKFFNYLSNRWQRELFASDTDLSDKLQAGNSLIALERLRKNIDRADTISLKMLNEVAKI